MPTTSVARTLADAPAIGSPYRFQFGTQRFEGVVRACRPLQKAKVHVHVILEIDERDHERITLGERPVGRALRE
jgi:hypothetical protein